MRHEQTEAAAGALLLCVTPFVILWGGWALSLYLLGGWVHV